MPLPKLSTQGASSLERVEELFRRYSPGLRRYVQKRLRRPSDVADLTQEIFEQFLRGDWQARVRDPHAYLFGIASNVVADARAADRRGLITYDSETCGRASESLSTPADEADQGALAAELQQELEAALAQLSEVHRAAILLTKRDGLSCKEAAARMRTTEGSVRVYVCEARAKLKTLLKRRSE